MAKMQLMMTRSRLVVLLGSSVAALALALSACSATQLGATEPNLASAKTKATPGSELFEKECAACHGKRGEGVSNGPPIIGATALPEYPRDKSLSTSPALSSQAAQQAGDANRPPGAPSRDPFRTAQDLYSYISTKMPLPKSRAGTLKPDEYWAITSFMLIAHGSAVPEGGVTAENAASVPIAPK
jgi:mono/diheme cytochrome c family protein